MIPINKPLIDEKEVEAVARVLKSGILTSRGRSGGTVEQFEKAFSEFVNAKHAFATSSGTAALHLSLLASGIQHGSEVIVPSFTFVSTCETVLLTGAKPVFVDVKLDTYNIDPDKIAGAVTAKTKAIVPVDLFGLPADLKPIREIADEHDLTVVEDAAQAHGARYKGKPVGNLADVACWSFYASKNMTTGEGGMVTTDSSEYAERMPYMRSHGEREEYVSTMIGGNFRMPMMEAAIGIVQLEKLPSFLKSRRRNAETLASKLQNVDNLQLPIVPGNCEHSWYLFTVRLKRASLKERDRVVEELRKLGVGATVYYRVPVHLMPFYHRYCKHHLPNTEKIADQVFSLPVHPAVTAKQIEHIAASLCNVLRGARS